MLVCHQASEHFDQLTLQVSVELCLNVEPVHVGEDGHDATKGMEVLDKGLKTDIKHSEK